MSAVSIDTSVIAEYVDLGGPFHNQATAVIDAVRMGELRGLIAHPVLAETYYVAERI